MAFSILAWIKRNSLIAYFLLAFAITWVLVSPLVLAATGLISIQISSHWHFLGAFGPIFAAVIVTGIVEGRSGLRELVARISNWRIGRCWLLIAILSPIMLFVVAAVILRITGIPWPDFHKLTMAEYANYRWVFGSLLSAVAYGIGEETGWRGFALPRLQKNRSALAATFILSIFWAIWHVPMFFYRFEFGVGQVIGFFIGLFAGAILFTYFYNSTGGSVFMVAVWHIVWNIVNIIGLVVSIDVVSMMSALVIIAAVVIVISWRRPIHITITKRQLTRLWMFLCAAVLLIILFPISVGMARRCLLIAIPLVWVGALFLTHKRKWLLAVIAVIGIGALCLLTFPGRAIDSGQLRTLYVQHLQGYEGARYIFGGENWLGIDCSGLVRRSLVNANLHLGIVTLNPSAVRQALNLWLHDTSAAALGS